MSTDHLRKGLAGDRSQVTSWWLYIVYSIGIHTLETTWLNCNRLVRVGDTFFSLCYGSTIPLFIFNSHDFKSYVFVFCHFYRTFMVSSLTGLVSLRHPTSLDPRHLLSLLLESHKGSHWNDHKVLTSDEFSQNCAWKRDFMGKPVFPSSKSCSLETDNNNPCFFYTVN